MAFPFKFSTLNFSGIPYDEDEIRKDREKNMFEGVFGSPVSEGAFDEDNPAINPPSMGVMQPHQMDMMEALREVQNRQRPANEALTKFLAQGYPNEQDYRPGKLTRLGAILSGAAAGFQNPSQGYAVARNIIDEPYRSAVERYKNEGSRLSSAASLESANEQRQFGYLNTLSQIQNRDYDNQIAAKRLQLDIDRAKAAGKTVINDERTGNVYSVDKMSGEKEILGNFKLTPEEKSKIAVNQAIDIEKGRSPIVQAREIAVGDRSAGHAMERARYTAGQAMERAKFGANAAMARIAVEQGNRIELTDRKDREIQARIRLRDQLKTNAAGLKQGIPAGTMSVGQERMNLANVRGLYRTNPEKYGKVWDPNTLDLKYDPKTGLPPVGSEEYNDYVDMFNLIYAGTKYQLSKQDDPRLIKVPGG